MVFVPTVAPKEVLKYYDLADVLVTCRTRGTNTPLKIYQYLRAGKPIVATAIESHTQVLDEGIAELVPPTPEGIAAGIERVLRDPPRAAAMAQAGVKRADERYGGEKYLRALEDFVDRVEAPSRFHSPAL
jgi:glycosyltransferase involved in cell wall biosynthesis